MEKGPENALTDFESFKKSIGEFWQEPLSNVLESERFEELYFYVR